MRSFGISIRLGDVTMLKEADIYCGSEAICGSALGNRIEWIHTKLPEVISDRKYSGTVILKDAVTDVASLCVKNCIFDELCIKDEEQSEISDFHFEQCHIGRLHLFQSNISLSLVQCRIDILIVEGCEMPLLKMEASAVTDAIILEKNSRINQISVSQDSAVCKIDSKDAEINRISIHSSVVDCIRVNHSIGEILLNEGAMLERFSIEHKEDLDRFLKGLSKQRRKLRKSSKNKKILEAKHQKQIVLAAFNQYDEEHRYQELDLCLVYLRKIDCALKRMESRNIFGKIAYAAEDFVMGKMFGWGVKISNTIVTTLATISGFAALYFYFLYCKAAETITWSAALWKAVYMSVNRFFNVAEEMTILPHFDTAEQITGVILLTIITGVLVRKIIK